MRRIIHATASNILPALATIVLVLAGCQNQPTESMKPAATAQSFSAKDIADRTIERRGVEAVIWGIPVVNYDAMYQAMVNAAHGGFNQILYWTHPSDWKNQTLTPNTDALYLMPFFNTKDVGRW